MNEIASQPSTSQLSAKIDDIVAGLKWMFSLLILFLSIPNFCSAMAIGRFALIFREHALPGKPLPFLTSFIINYSILLHALVFVWPAIGILNIIYGKHLKFWMIGTAAIVFFIGLQIFLTWVGCFLPMTDLMNGMSDVNSK